MRRLKTPLYEIFFSNFLTEHLSRLFILQRNIGTGR
jgi:hypothetical protein